MGRPKAARGIEDLLRWAYCEELPKAARERPDLTASAWDIVQRYYGDLSLALAKDNQYGVVPDWRAFGAPHPDAIVIHEAVAALDDRGLGLPDDWTPFFADLDGNAEFQKHSAALIARALDAMGFRVGERAGSMREAPRWLVVRHAILKGEPDWWIESPVVRFVTEGPNGKKRWFRRIVRTVGEGAFGEPLLREIEVDGWNAKGFRPYADAYTKTYLDPNPLPGVIGRAEYELWRNALDVLVEELHGKMAEHEALASARPLRPWLFEEGDEEERVWPDLSVRPPAPARRRRRA